MNGVDPITRPVSLGERFIVFRHNNNVMPVGEGRVCGLSATSWIGAQREFRPTELRDLTIEGNVVGLGRRWEGRPIEKAKLKIARPNGCVHQPDGFFDN